PIVIILAQSVTLALNTAYWPPERHIELVSISTQRHQYVKSMLVINPELNQGNAIGVIIVAD
ncbi:hypothetical protein ACPV5V_25455, partial [Vibrio campbellii]